MINIQLPFTCEQGSKIIYGLRWAALLAFPIMLAYSVQTNQIPLSGNESLWVHPLFSWGVVGSGVGWISQILWWCVTSWPFSFSFKQPNSREVKE